MSPVRLSFVINSPEMQSDLFGALVNVSADKENEIKIKIRLSETKGKECKGILVVIPALGFESKRAEQSVIKSLAPGVVAIARITKSKLPFTLAPNESKEITVVLTGKLPDGLHSSYCYVKAEIDAETEAQPIVLTIAN